MTRLSRRQALLGAAAMACAPSGKTGSVRQRAHLTDAGVTGTDAGGPRPNVLLLMTDDQRGDAASAYGNPHMTTPGLDRIIREGVSFRNAYAAAPQCFPARFAVLNGVHPSDGGCRSNSICGNEALADPIIAQSIGHQLGSVGYDCAWAGKAHVHWITKKYGLQTYFGVGRYRTVDSVGRFLGHMAERPDPSKPWFFFCSLVNPHDIELWPLYLYQGTPMSSQLIAALENPAGVDDEAFFRSHAPPMPCNEEPTDIEPESIAKLMIKHGEVGMTRNDWTEQDWRRYLWAYARLCETVDVHISNVMAHLDASPYANDTVVIFLSDHGTMLGAHLLSGKQVPYREALWAPLVVRPPGGLACPREDDTLINTGLDVLPTVCDYAGVSTPHYGRSLRPAVEGGALEKRVHVADYHWGYAAFDGRYRLWKEDQGDVVLFDTLMDPGESRNVGGDPAYAGAIAELEGALDAHIGSRP